MDKPNEDNWLSLTLDCLNELKAHYEDNDQTVNVREMETLISYLQRTN
jgi:hypothetical protein